MQDYLAKMNDYANCAYVKYTKIYTYKYIHADVNCTYLKQNVNE